MREKILKQSINRLNINDNTILILKENKINLISELCKRSKTDFKKIGLQQDEINKIQIELQLLGLNIRGGL